MAAAPSERAIRCGGVMPNGPLPLDVFFQPPDPALLAGAAVVVIDILRATTVQAALLTGGAEAIYPVAEWADAQALREAMPGAKLIGEVNSLPGPGAEFGNSPTEFAALDVRGWRAIQVTGNGTRALSAAAGAPLVLSGCLRNLSACADALASEAAASRRPIAVVCSGDHGGRSASLEDAVAAGAYAEALAERLPLTLADGALIARGLWRSYAEDPPAALQESPHGRDLLELGFSADLAYAAAIDAEPIVPQLSADAQNQFRLQPLG